MRTFYDYASYAAWRKTSGGASTESVRLVGGGCDLWPTLFAAQATIARLTDERDALVAVGLACCDGTPNPTLPRVELAISFIKSTAEARKTADMLWREYKTKSDKADAERDAIAAAAFEAAANVVLHPASKQTGGAAIYRSRLLALTPADATAALEARDRRMKAAGMRDAAGINVARTGRDWVPNSLWDRIAKDHRGVILARADAVERGEA